ncbi:MAG: response regulator [Magnetococcus sp. YQC-9]
MTPAGFVISWKGSIFTFIKRGIVLASLAIAIVAIAIGWLTYELKDQIEKDHRVLQATTHLAAAESDLWRLRYAFPQFMMADKDEQQRILDEQAMLAQHAEQHLKAFEEAALNEEERKLAVEARSAYERYRDTRPRFFELWQQGGREDAVAWQALTATPFGRQTVEIFDHLIERQRNDAQKRYAANDRLIQRQIVLLVLITLMVFAGLGILSWLALRLFEPVRELDKRARKIILDQFGDDVAELVGGNELAALTRNVSQMSDRLIAYTEEVDRHQQHLEELVTARTLELSHTLSLVESTLEASDNGILVVDLQGKITLINKRFGKMWRVPQELIDSGNDEQVLAYGTRQLVDPQKFLDKVLALYNKPAVSSRDTLLFKDGRVFARFSHPQRLDTEIIGRVWSFLDITEQYRAEQRIKQLSQVITDELEQSERERGQLQALLASIPDLVWMKDSNGKYLTANPAFGVLMGSLPEQILGKTDLDFFPPDVVAAFRADDHSAADSPTPIVRQEWVTYLSDGHHGLLETIKTAVRAKDGKLIGVLGVARDITKSHVLMEELQQARRDAQKSSEAKGTFLANMSHEIRTPMNAIIGMTDLALATQLTLQQQNYLEKIKVASDSLLHIINDILDFSKIEVGKLELERVPFVLEDVFSPLASVMGLQAEKQGVELNFDIDGEDYLLVGDSLRLGQVLINLVTNAVKFSKGGNVVVQTRVLKVWEHTVELQITVSDQGIGMTADQVANLFQPFSQADNSTTRQYGGTGLGLAISRNLVELMGGRIWAESQPNQGSTFHFTVQLEIHDENRRSGTRHFAIRLAKYADHTILIVDDNKIALIVLSRLIEQLGLKAEPCSSATEALALIAANETPNYLACLIDRQMPEVDGVETIHLLRETFRKRKITPPPMLLVLAYTHQEEFSKVNQRIDGVLAKPVIARHFYIELSRCLGIVDDTEPVADRRKGVKQWSRFRGLDILLAEDIEVNQEVIKGLLANVGLSVRIVYNGIEVLNEVENQCPDLILMDCHMPVLDGYEATRRLREIPAYQDLPIIALTANATLIDQEKCYTAGMNAHVAKPVRMENLFEKMLHCLPDYEPSAIHPASSSNVSSLIPGFPDLPGIQITVGLKNVGGRNELFLRVLRMFRDRLARDFEPQYRAALETSQWEDQVRLAHSLKGVANTIGATELTQSSLSLMHAAQEKQATQCEERFKKTLADLTIVLSGLERL